MRAQDFKRSAELLSRFVRSPIAQTDDYLKLAAARRATGDVAGALGAASEAARLAPHAFPPILMCGSLMQALGRREEAAELYRKALRMAPDARALPPPFLAALQQARDLIAADDSWRATVAAVDLTPFSGLPRDRLEGFRENILGGPRVDGGPGQFMYPGMSRDAWFDTADIPGVRAVEAETHSICEEFRRVVEARLPELVSFDAHTGRAESGVDGAGQWSAVRLFAEGEADSDNLAQCSRTAVLHRKLDIPFVRARSPNLMFSILDARTTIPAHTGVTNTRLVIHLPLIVPPGGCGIRVGSETREWKVGKAIVFDDSIEHEAWNDSDALRVVLLGDIWRPEIAVEERAAIAELMAV